MKFKKKATRAKVVLLWIKVHLNQNKCTLTGVEFFIFYYI